MDNKRLMELAGVQLNEKSDADFFTDFGKSFNTTDSSGKKTLIMDRYGVWGDTGKGKPQVIDTSDSIDALKKKYGDLPVQKIS